MQDIICMAGDLPRCPTRRQALMRVMSPLLAAAPQWEQRRGGGLHRVAELSYPLCFKCLGPAHANQEQVGVALQACPGGRLRAPFSPWAGDDLEGLAAIDSRALGKHLPVPSLFANGGSRRVQHEHELS